MTFVCKQNTFSYIHTFGMAVADGSIGKENCIDLLLKLHTYATTNSMH